MTHGSHATMKTQQHTSYAPLADSYNEGLLTAEIHPMGALNLQGIEFARKGGRNCKKRKIQGKAPKICIPVNLQEMDFATSKSKRTPGMCPVCRTDNN